MLQLINLSKIQMVGALMLRMLADGPSIVQKYEVSPVQASKAFGRLHALMRCILYPDGRAHLGLMIPWVFAGRPS